MTTFLPGPCGKLEARLWVPPGREPPRAACVVCHPHPLRGGTMHNTVVFRTARALQEAGLAVLRFNFRGAGRSAGEHHGNGGEEEDARAALDWLAAEVGDVPLWAGGFSFGARTVAALATREARIRRLVLIALPVAVFDCSVIAEVRTPGLVCQAGDDEFGNLNDLVRLHPGLDPGLELYEVPGADHFFAGHVKELQRIVGEAARRWLAQ